MPLLELVVQITSNVNEISNKHEQNTSEAHSCVCFPLLLILKLIKYLDTPEVYNKNNTSSYLPLFFLFSRGEGVNSS